MIRLIISYPSMIPRVCIRLRSAEGRISSGLEKEVQSKQAGKRKSSWQLAMAGKQKEKIDRCFAKNSKRTKPIGKVYPFGIETDEE